MNARQPAAPSATGGRTATVGDAARDARSGETQRDRRRALVRGLAIVAMTALAATAAPAAGPAAAQSAPADEAAARVLYGCLSGPTTEEDRSGFNSGPMSLCTVRSDGTDRVVVVDKEFGYVSVASWSPDGRRFAYPDTTWQDGDGGVVVSDADGSNRRVVAEGEYREVLWSPDGTKLAVTSSSDGPEHGLTVIDLTDDSRRRLTDRSAGRITWAPDGSQIAFVNVTAADPEHPVSELAVIPAAGGAIRFLGLESNSTKTTWSPDGRWLLEGFRLVSPDDGSTKMIRPLPSGWQFATTEWSPDGTQISFLLTGDNGEAIGVMGADGSDLRILVRLATQPFLPPSWTPDGTALIYSHTRQDPDIETQHIDGDLFRIALDGSVPQQITHGDSAHRPVLPRLVTRPAGATRTDTSVSTSRTTYPSAGTVVLARADLFPDALSAAPLAAKAGAPLLLSAPDRASDAVLAEVRRLGARTAYLIGDTTALSSDVEAQLRAAGVATIRRVGGTTRYDTAAAIAREVGGGEVYLASGQDFPDAAAVSALASFQRRPILLTSRDTLPAATDKVLSDLSATSVTVIGGPAAVSEQTAQQAGEGRQMNRYAGSDRYATSARIAEGSLQAGMNAARPWLATGRAFPDALSAGPAAATHANVLLLVDPVSVHAAAAVHDWLAAHRSDYDEVVAVGGPDVVSPVVTTTALR